MSVAVEGHSNFAQSFGLSDDPIVEQVRLTLTVDTDANREQVLKIEEQARDRCPAMYVLGRIIPCHTELKFQ